MSGKGGPTTHGALLFWKKGTLPVGKRHIARQVDAVIAEMVEDLGGAGEITAAQRIIIATIRQDLVFLGLIHEWIERQPSIIDKSGEVLAPLGGFYLACQNTVTRNVRELGLKRVVPVQSLEKYLETKAETAHRTQGGNSKGKGARREKIVDPGASCEKIGGEG